MLAKGREVSCRTGRKQPQPRVGTEGPGEHFAVCVDKDSAKAPG